MKKHIIFLILTFTFLNACKEKPHKPFMTGLESKSMVDFTILLPDSSTYFNTRSLQRGKKTVIFCYSPTCPYCRAQMRGMLNNIQQYKDVQLVVITGADFESMKGFNNYFGLEGFNNIITGIDTGNVMVKTYQAYDVPFTAFFDNDKRLIAAYSGRITNKIFLGVIHP